MKNLPPPGPISTPRDGISRSEGSPLTLIKDKLNSDESVGFGPLPEPTACFGTRSRAWAGNIKDELNSDESVGFGPLLEPTEGFGISSRNLVFRETETHNECCWELQ